MIRPVRGKPCRNYNVARVKYYKAGHPGLHTPQRRGKTGPSWLTQSDTWRLAIARIVKMSVFTVRPRRVPKRVPRRVIRKRRGPRANWRKHNISDTGLSRSCEIGRHDYLGNSHRLSRLNCRAMRKRSGSLFTYMFKSSSADIRTTRKFEYSPIFRGPGDVDC